MHTLPRLFAAIAAGAMSFSAANAATGAPSDPVAAQASAIRDRFVSAIRNCGAAPSFVPPVVVDSHADIVSYSYTDRSVHLTRWTDLPPPFKDFIAAWAAQGTMGLRPEDMFREIFNDFLVAHELGHYLKHLSGRAQTLDPTDAETEANRIALAFWALDPTERERLPARYANFTNALLTLPDPVPSGLNARDYLAENYAIVARNGVAHGWYQGRFMKEAWEKRGERDFCGWVKANPPNVSSKVK